MFLLQADQVGFDRGETLWRNNVWMRRYWPIRKPFDGLVRLLDESPAHEHAVVPEAVSKVDASDPSAELLHSVATASISLIRVNFSLGLPFGLPRFISASSSIDSVGSQRPGHRAPPAAHATPRALGESEQLRGGRILLLASGSCAGRAQDGMPPARNTACTSRSVRPAGWRLCTVPTGRTLWTTSTVSMPVV